MARIQPANGKAETVPSYDRKVISEVTDSSKVHEQVSHVKYKTIIQTSDDDQIDSNIIFDYPYVENNGGTSEHDSNAHDEYHEIQILSYNVQREAENQKRLNNELKNQKRCYKRSSRHIVPAAQLVPRYHTIGRCNNYDMLQSIPCSTECKIVGKILLDHPLSYALTATADVPVVYLQQFSRTVSNVHDTEDTWKLQRIHLSHQSTFRLLNLSCTGLAIKTKINILQLFHAVINRTNVIYAALLWWDFMNNVFQKKEAIQYSRFIKLIIVDLMNKFPNISQRTDEDYYSIKDDIPLVSLYTIGNVLVRGMLIPDEFLTKEISAANDFKKYETVFMNVDVLMNQSQPVVSTQGTHMITPRAYRTPILTTANYCPDYQYVVSIKEDTGYPLPTSPKNQKETDPIVHINHQEDDAPSEGEKRVKKHKASKSSKSVRGSSSKRSAKDYTTYVSKQQQKQQEWDAWVEETVIDEDEVIPKDETPKLITELLNVDKHVPTIFDHARIEATLNDMLNNQFKNAEENPNEPPRYLHNKDLFFLKNGNNEEKKFILSLHRIHVERFPKVDLEEKMNHWRVHDFQLGIESYQVKVNLTAPTLTFPGIEAYEPYSIVDKLTTGLIYLNSKNEKRAMYLVEIVKFFDATLKKVLKEVKFKIFQSEP
ncbi:hypothetical protein Tco_0704625 [Tanacetum coccineum]|uniref:Uncharacterized protein n=1 Tax=Tanacetum coccineum TaxID=301880 RepID=A0ABQ4Y279_9ASTR